MTGCCLGPPALNLCPPSPSSDTMILLSCSGVPLDPKLKIKLSSSALVCPDQGPNSTLHALPHHTLAELQQTGDERKATTCAYYALVLIRCSARVTWSCQTVTSAHGPVTRTRSCTEVSCSQWVHQTVTQHSQIPSLNPDQSSYTTLYLKISEFRIYHTLSTVSD